MLDPHLWNLENVFKFLIVCLCRKWKSLKFKLQRIESEAGLPKMDQLIEFGLIHPGDQVYITVKPTESVATLLDAKYVDYKGNKITLNDWGCQVTGWSAIRIYSYVAVVGETETLHQKRLAYVNEHNEP